MDHQQEMMQLQELFDAVKEVFGFAGNIILQYAGRNSYAEKKGVEAMLSHLHEGGRIDSMTIRPEASQGFEEMLKDSRVPYASFEVEIDDGAKMQMYTFRDRDRAIVKDIIRQMEIDLPGERQREKSKDVYAPLSQPKSERNKEPDMGLPM